MMSPIESLINAAKFGLVVDDMGDGLYACIGEFADDVLISFAESVPKSVQQWMIEKESMRYEARGRIN